MASELLESGLLYRLFGVGNQAWENHYETILIVIFQLLNFPKIKVCIGRATGMNIAYYFFKDLAIIVM